VTDYLKQPLSRKKEIMPGKAAKVRLSEKQMDILSKITRESTVSVRLRQRARIILLAHEGKRNEEIASAVQLGRRQVGIWRQRWQVSWDALIAIECTETTTGLRRAIEEVLSDAPRPGCGGTFTAEQVTGIIAIACEDPKKCERPIDYWTGREIADEAMKRGIVTSISARQVNRYLAAASLQPHRSRYWLNTKEKDPEVFQTQVELVCQTYLHAADLYFQSQTYTVSTDEMSIQALERIAETIPMQPAQPARIEFEYTRHGTMCLIGNWDVVQGQMIAPTIRATRTNVDFMWHIYHTVQTDADAGWVFLVDQLNIHCSEELVRYVAEVEGMDPATLGKKRRPRNSSIDGHASGVSVRHHSPCPVCVSTQAHVLAEPDRNDLRHRVPSRRSPRQLSLYRGTEGTPA